MVINVFGQHIPAMKRAILEFVDVQHWRSGRPSVTAINDAAASALRQ
jgi:hypothetical protein